MAVWNRAPFRLTVAVRVAEPIAEHVAEPVTVAAPVAGAIATWSGMKKKTLGSTHARRPPLPPLTQVTHPPETLVPRPLS